MSVSEENAYQIVFAIVFIISIILVLNKFNHSF